MRKRLTIDRLEWDSSFFGFPVGRIKETLAQDDRQELQYELKQQNYRLLYSTSPNRLAQGFEQNYVVTQVTYCKSLHCNNELQSAQLSQVATPYPKQIANKPLRQLAYEAGWSSRFRIDPNIDLQFFYKLYDIWIDRSCLREIAEEVLVVESADGICGFVTLKVSNNETQISLIAVNTQYRGKGIGEILMKSAQEYALQRDCTSIKVVTQSNNVAAIRLYEKQGMALVDTQHWYHFWRNSIGPT